MGRWKHRKGRLATSDASLNSPSAAASESLGGEAGRSSGCWSCECAFSLLLVGLLAALPFNLHTHDLLHTRDGYSSRAAKYASEGDYGRAIGMYQRAVSADEGPDDHFALADIYIKLKEESLPSAYVHYSLAADLFYERGASKLLEHFKTLGENPPGGALAAAVAAAGLLDAAVMPGSVPVAADADEFEALNNAMEAWLEGDGLGAPSASAIAEWASDLARMARALISAGGIEATMGHPARAAANYARVLELQPALDPAQLAEAHVQMARLLFDCRHHEAALQHIDVARRTVPDLPAAATLRPQILRDSGRLLEAIADARRTAAKRPRDSTALAALGLLLHEHGDFDGARTIYKSAVASGGSSAPEIVYMTAALSQRQVQPPRAPSAYSSLIFDLEARLAATEGEFLPHCHEALLVATAALRSNHAADGSNEAARSKERGADSTSSTGEEDSFFYQVHGLIYGDSIADTILTGLESALGLPSTLPEATEQSTASATSPIPSGSGSAAARERTAEPDGLRWLDTLDLGCGRGAVGQRLRYLANTIMGVDLSRTALRHAENSGYYDQLTYGDAEVILAGMEPRSFDLVVAADFFSYFGDVSKLLRMIANVLRPGGLAAVSVELLDFATEPNAGVAGHGHNGANGAAEKAICALQATGRWAHNKEYFLAQAQAQGLGFFWSELVGARLPGPVKALAPKSVVLMLRREA